MNVDLLMVLGLLIACIGLFIVDKPRMDVVALLVIVVLPLTGIISVPEALAGFSDTNVVLIAALFVIGEGLTRTGIAYRLSDQLISMSGNSEARLLILLMLAVAGLGSVMSSTGVVAIFVPVALNLAERLRASPRHLMMPLAYAGLISGMLTLVGTAPNMVVDGALRDHGFQGFNFFSFTPFGAAVLIIGVANMMVTRHWLGVGETSWKILLLIVGVMPFAVALERTGGVDLAVNGLLHLVGEASPHVLLASLFVLTAAIGLFISNTATAVLMAPIALSTANHLGASPYPFAMTVALASSAAFMTPISSPVNTLVLGPGQYRFGDFVKLGVPFTVLVLLVTTVMVPWFFPLH